MSELLQFPSRQELACQVSKLELEPGDVLVARLDFEMTGEQMQNAERLMQAITGHPVLVIDRRCDLSVLTRAEIESRTHV